MLDLSNTIGFAIADGVSPRTARSLPADGCMPSTLYAMQDNGDMVITTMTETTDETDASVCTTNMQTEQASAIYDTNKYVVIRYSPPLSLGENGNQTLCGFIVMRKSDGALFCDSRTAETQLREVEGQNDKLYFGSTGALARLDMSTDPPTVTVILDGMQTGDTVDEFDVDGMDNALANGNFGLRIFKANGGLQNISASGGTCQWFDPNGSFYYAQNELETGNQPGRTIVRRLDGATYTPTVVGQIVVNNTASLFACDVALAAGTQTVGYAPGSPSLIELVSSTGTGQCWQKFSSPNGACTTDADCDGTCTTCGTSMCCVGGGNPGRPCGSAADCIGTCITAGTQHPVNGITMLKSAVGSGTKVFIQGTDAAGNGAVIQVDVPGFTQTTLLAAGEYTLNAISLSKSGELTFAGLRNSDGAHVIGNCTSAGCTVLNATAPTVSALQRIN